MLQTFLDSIVLGPIQSAEGMEVVPILLRRPQELPPIRTLDGALGRRVLEIRELQGGARVDTVRGHNRSAGLVLLLDGEELVGARQDRILNSSVLLSPGAQLLLPVSCVERGRWKPRSPIFSSGGRMGSASLRSRKTRRVAHSLAHTGQHASDQSEIWSDVDRQTVRLGAANPTQAMQSGHIRHQERLRRQTSALRTLPGQVGVLGLFRRRVLALDALGDPALYRAVREKLLQSYALDTVGQKPSARWDDPVRVAERFLQSLREAQARPAPAVGAGTELRLEGPDIHGSALLLDGALVHLAAFPS